MPPKNTPSLTIKMGFTQRWGEVLVELVEYVKTTPMG